jgi:exodeoxyribonuclease-3
VRISTWNVNSVKQRLPRLLPWLDERRPDVVCLQETKLTDDAFRELMGDELSDRGYAVAAHGEAAWNGVAILSRVGLEDVVPGIPGDPASPHPEARAVAATCGGIRVVSVYVPNGRAPDSEHYHYKLAWLKALRDVVAADPEATVVCGDVNIAPATPTSSTRTPTSARPTSPAGARGARRAAAPRAARRRARPVPDERVFTYWDYRAGCSTRTSGCGSTSCSPAPRRRARAGRVGGPPRPQGQRSERPRAVIVDLDEAPDGDIGPVVPPPSRPAKRGTKKLPQAAP